MWRQVAVKVPEGKRHCSGGKVPQGLHERTRCESDVHNDDLFSAGAAVPRTNSGQESSAHAASAFAGQLKSTFMSSKFVTEA